MGLLSAIIARLRPAEPIATVAASEPAIVASLADFQYSVATNATETFDGTGSARRVAFHYGDIRAIEPTSAGDESTPITRLTDTWVNGPVTAVLGYAIETASVAINEIAVVALLRSCAHAVAAHRDVPASRQIKFAQLGAVDAAKIVSLVEAYCRGE